MATVDELARDVLAAIATDANALAVAKWIDNRYKEMVSKVKFRHLRQVGELSIPGAYKTGTISAVRGSAAIVGVATQFATDITIATHQYYYFRTRSAWYKIAAVVGELNLTLNSIFAEDDIAGGSYVIAKRHHSLISTARWIGDFYHTRLRKKLLNVSLDELNIADPGRSLAGNIPRCVAQIGVDTNNNLMVEIYPSPNVSEMINYIYWMLPTTLSIDSTIPPVIDTYTLKEGVLIDLYRFEKAVALRKGNVEQAVVWRNEEKAQYGIWDKAIKDAIRTSRGADDITIILDYFNARGSGGGEQRTARDYVYDNWTR